MSTVADAAVEARCASKSRDLPTHEQHSIGVGSTIQGAVKPRDSVLGGELQAQVGRHIAEKARALATAEQVKYVY